MKNGNRERWWPAMKKDDLRRTKRFKKHLAQQLQVEQPPESYFQAVQNAFDNLPDELPVKRRPFHQTALRACAALAACLVLVAGGVYGTYLVNPMFMESLPGIGQIFQEWDKEKAPSPSPSPSPNWEEESRLTEKEALPEVPPFDPVSFEGNEGTLTVQNAWSDGVYLHLDLAVEWPDTDMSIPYLTPCLEPYAQETDTSSVLINGEAVSNLQLSEQGAFTLGATQAADERAADNLSPEASPNPTEPSRNPNAYTASWIYKLPEQQPHKTELTVELSIPTLVGTSDMVLDNSWRLECGFYGDFTVTVDASRTLTQEPNVEDNGVTFNSVEVTPTCVVTKLSIPQFGWMNSTLLLPYFQNIATESPVPLGITPQLTTSSGETIPTTTLPVVDGSTSSNPSFSLSKTGTYDLVTAFDGLPEGTDQLILTLYEYDPSYLDGQYTSANRVTAEFTIDLSQNTVYPSQNYLSAGRQKLDYRISSSLDRTPDPENGYICSIPNPYGSYLELILYTKDSEYHPVTLNRYENDQLISYYNSVPQEEYNSATDAHSIYQDANYVFWEAPLDSPYTPDGYTMLCFQMYDVDVPASAAGSSSTRFELVDSETGDVLIPDIQRTYMKQCDQVFGTEYQSSYYGEASAFEEQAIASTPSDN